MNTIFLCIEFVIHSSSHQIFIKGLLYARQSSKFWETSLDKTYFLKNIYFLNTIFKFIFFAHVPWIKKIAALHLSFKNLQVNCSCGNITNLPMLQNQ